jgi:hypothetical protein
LAIVLLDLVQGYEIYVSRFWSAERDSRFLSERNQQNRIDHMVKPKLTLCHNLDLWLILSLYIQIGKFISGLRTSAILCPKDPVETKNRFTGKFSSEL